MLTLEGKIRSLGRAFTTKVTPSLKSVLLLGSPVPHYIATSKSRNQQNNYQKTNSLISKFTFKPSQPSSLAGYYELVKCARAVGSSAFWIQCSRLL
jgi:hypothetical protein